MLIFKLVPVNSTDPAWRNSCYRGPLTIRARSEGQARRAAEIVTLVSGSNAPRQGFRSPWLMLDKAYCILVASEDESDAVAIIDPKGLDAEIGIDRRPDRFPAR